MARELVNFTKKPVEVTTTLFIGGEDNGVSIVHWIRSLGGEANYNPAVPPWQSDDGSSGHNGYPEQIQILTLEGEVRTDVGDYIIRGIKGEFYPCKPDIFLQSYITPGVPTKEALPVLIELPEVSTRKFYGPDGVEIPAEVVAELQALPFTTPFTVDEELDALNNDGKVVEITDPNLAEE